MRVLVVEDSPPTRDLLKHSLEEAGCEVALASRFSTGLKLASQGSFDALVIDVMLPDGDGFELCRELRRLGTTTPILFLTARGDVADRIAGLDAGGDDYLRKPFALAELHARLRALARRQGLAPPRLLEARGTRIDFSARRLTRGSGEVPMTAREWAVLEVLAGRPGRLVPREELLDLVWNAAGPAASDSLDVIVSRLRRKLGAAEGGIAVRTLRGQGYVLEVPA